AWLIAHHQAGFESYSDLFDYFLLDVEMSACATTSRIRQALSSVQLLVQRSLLGLETELALTPEDAEEWEAMSRYRVWEANRKILLYPENWLDPELRDDKSPFFKELEDELLQSNLEPHAIDQAIVNYLSKIVDVSKLEVVGYEIERDPVEGPLPYDARPQVEHVIARTPAQPYKYFYRRRLNGHRWTPWEPIPLDIVGDQVLPVVFQGVIHLFWLNIQEREEEPPGGFRKPPEGEERPPSQKPRKFREFPLEWSSCRDGRWSPKKTSVETVTDKNTIGIQEYVHQFNLGDL